MPDTESSRRKSGVCFKRFAWHECSLRLYPTRLFQEIDYGFGLASRHFRISRAPLQPELSDLFRSLSVDPAAFPHLSLSNGLLVLAANLDAVPLFEDFFWI